MAEFVEGNERRVNVGDSFMGSSKGIKNVDPLTATDKSSTAGLWAKDAGDLLGMVTKTVERTIEVDMEHEIERVKAGADEEFGTAAATDIEDSNVNDAGISRSITKIKRMQDAYNRGEMDELTYQTWVTAQLREKRSQLGYRDRQKLDSMMQNELGVSQNAARRALLARLNAQSNEASASDAAWTRALQQEGDNLPPADVQLMKTDYQAFKAKYPTAESLIVGGIPLKSAKTQVEMRKSQLDLYSKQDEVGEDQITDSLSGLSADIINRNFTALGGSLPEMQKFEQLIKANREKPSAENQQALLQFTQEFKQRTTKEIMSSVMDYGAKNKVPAEKLNKIVKESISMVDTLLDPATNEKFGGLYFIKLMAEANKQDSEYKFGKGDFGRFMNFFGANGNSFLANAMAERMGIYTNKGLQLDLSRELFDGKVPKRILQGLGTTGKVLTEEELIALNRVTLSAIKDVKDNPEALQDLVSRYFSPENQEYISRFSDPKVQTRMWAELLDPDLQTALKSGSGITYQAYQQYVRTEFAANARRTIGRLSSITDAQGKPVAMWDANAKRFVVNAQVPTVIDEVNIQTVEAIKQAKPYVDQLNMSLAVMSPIFKADNTDPSLYISQINQTSKLPGMMNLGMNGAESAMSGADQLSAKEGTEVELQELIKSFNQTEDPELRAMIKQEIKDKQALKKQSLSDVPAGTVVMAPSDGQSNLGGPVNVGAVAQSEISKEVVDMLTGIPSVMEALQSGDMAALGAALAGVIPFPGAKVGKMAKALDRAGEVIDPIVLEGKQIAKEMEQKALKDSQALKDMEASGQLKRSTFTRAETLPFDELIKAPNVRGGGRNTELSFPSTSKKRSEWDDKDKAGVSYLRNRLEELARIGDEGSPQNLQEIEKITKYLRKLEMSRVE